MHTILLLTHTEADGSMPRAGLEALTAASALAGQLEGARLVVGLYGAAVQPAADAIASSGAERMLGVFGEDYATARYATDAAAAEALCRAAEATLVLTPGTSRAARVMPGVAHRLGGRVDTHVVSVEVADGEPAVSRWFYRQRMQAVLKRAGRPWVLVLDPGVHAPFEASAGSATVEPVQVALSDGGRRTTVTGERVPESDEQTIRPDADLLFVAGAGWTKKQSDGETHVGEAAELIRGFLGATKASLGSSKSLVDIGGEGQEVLPFLSHLNQVGQTGSTPRHPKGLSTCCHGEEPHVVGWRFIGDRRAVNLDAACGWARGKADVLYVADAFEVMKKVNALLAERRGNQ